MHRFMATGIAGLSVAVDSLSDIKHAQVKVLRDESGPAVDYAIDGDFPAFGNNDDRADTIAVDLVERFMDKIHRQPTYRGAEPACPCSPSPRAWCTASTPATPPTVAGPANHFAPGANPMNGRDSHGMVAAALSVAKLPYSSARDGISLTITATPDGLGHTRDERIGNLAGVLDGYTDAATHRSGHQRLPRRPCRRRAARCHRPGVARHQAR
ncbi:pyruvate formate lyase family protein [Actinoplanes sichuanensis]